MGFVESFGYFMLVVLTIVGMYLLFKLLPFCASVAVTFTLYQYVIEAMAVPSQDPTLVHFVVCYLYVLGFIVCLAFDLACLDKRLDNLGNDFDLR